MTYESARRSEIVACYDKWIDEYAVTYLPGRPTVVFLPGGMGSQLDRSKTPYVNDNSLPLGQYDPVWMDLGMVFDKEAKALAIAPDGRDAGSHIIRPNGPLRFPTKPYDATERYFRTNGCNYIPFSFDWRRPLVECADCLKEFLRRLKGRVKALRGEDPLPTTTILCHSMGGLVAKVFLHRVLPAGSSASAYAKWFARVVTAGTPFYGTGTHMPRYFVGVEPLDIIYKREDLARIVASMPGPYILGLLDAATFQRDGADLGLARYPVRDGADLTQDADPFSDAMMARWPAWVSHDLLRQTRRVYELLSRRLPAHLARRVYHLRSGLQPMPVELVWDDIDGAAFNPSNDPSPFASIMGPGDGTVPFWSARLAQSDDDHVYDLQQVDDHGELLEHGETLDAVWHLIEHDALPGAPISNPTTLAGVAKASITATRQYLADADAGVVQWNDPPDPRIWRTLVEASAVC